MSATNKDNPVIFPKPNKDGTFSRFPKEESSEMSFPAPDSDGSFAPFGAAAAPVATQVKPPRHKGIPTALRK